MHKEFLKLLEKATGRSEHVIAVNLDIRGFTPFCETEDSLNVATYITRVYLKIINDYFKSASFYKPTGDGLIIIIPYDRENLREVANLTVNSCLGLLENFGSLCSDNHMINYPTPQNVGIGVARGSACCIISEDKSKILDYSGRLLNLASRLMDLARPSGIVLDGSFGIELLEDETKNLFSEDIVYVRGVAEEEPMKIYYSTKHTLIPDSYHHPLKEPKWETQTYEYSFEALKKFVADLTPELKKKPLDTNKIRVIFSYNTKLGTRWLEYSVGHDYVAYKPRGYINRVHIDLPSICKYLEKQGIKEDTRIQIKVVYPIK